MRPARCLADVCDAVAVFGPGFRVVGLTKGKVMLWPLEEIPGPQARLEIAARAEALGLSVSWSGRRGIVARRVCWPGGAPRGRGGEGRCLLIEGSEKEGGIGIARPLERRLRWVLSR